LFRKMHWAPRSRLKREVIMRLMSQRQRRFRPVSGKPLVILTRKSSAQPDQDSSWGKIIVDCLKVRGGIGAIVDDSPEHVEVETFWRKAPSGQGRIIVEVLERIQ
jgi:hypothetical protein